MEREAMVLYADEMTDETPPMLHEVIADRRAWRRDTFVLADALVPFPQTGIAELDAVAQWAHYPPEPLDLSTLATFSLPVCADVMARARWQIQHQGGLAIIDRIPVERYSVDENKIIGLLLATLMGQVVEQKWDGTVLYDVKDAGKPLGYGVRRSVTNLEQHFHTDGGWLWMPPSAIGLFCLHPAQAGGMSRFVSLGTVHNIMQQQCPDLLARLYRPFWWDRQAEHASDEVRFCAHPVYQYDGKTLLARYYEDYIIKGYQLAGETLDAAGHEALAAMRAIVDDPAHWVEFRLEKGQLQYLDNRQFAHARTAFSNTEEAAAQRHLLRLWNRDEGRPDLEG